MFLGLRPGGGLLHSSPYVPSTRHRAKAQTPWQQFIPDGRDVSDNHCSQCHMWDPGSWFGFQLVLPLLIFPALEAPYTTSR